MGVVLRIIAALLAMRAAVSSAECRYGVHLGTYHTNREGSRQEFNPGAWAVCDGVTAGGYLNSRNKASFYAGYTMTFGPVDVTAGAVSGYGKPSPLLVPSIGLPHGPRIALVPPHDHRSGGVHFMWEF